MTHALIIDDNADNVGILEEMLTMEGINFTSLHDPAKLEAKIKNQPSYDVVFLDLEMPNVDGYEMFRRLKADARFQNVPIVAYTVHVSEINEIRKLGFHSFLGKPLDADAFPRQLQRILKGERVWANP
jgi:two-component system sensor histidine kinase/response regulator